MKSECLYNNIINIHNFKFPHHHFHGMQFYILPVAQKISKRAYLQFTPI